MAKINMNSPKVSVIIPVYNGEEYLPMCLDSVVNQQEGLKGSAYCFAKRCRDFLRIMRYGKPKDPRFGILFKGIWAGFFFHPKVENIVDIG